MKKLYEAEDNSTFEDPVECASYEFAHCPGVLDRFNAVMESVHPRKRSWCGGDPRVISGGFGCACVGCCNRELYDAGFDYFYHAAWEKDYRKEFDADDSHPLTNYEEVNLVMVDPGANRVNVLLKIRQISGVGVLEAKKMMLPDAIICAGHFYYFAKDHIKEFEQLGATVKAVRK